MISIIIVLSIVKKIYKYQKNGELIKYKKYQVSLHNIYYIFVSVILIAVIGIRNISVGADTYVYFSHFQNLNSIKFIKIFDYYKADYGFYIFTWILSRIIRNFNIYLIITASIYIIPITLLIKRESRYPLFSYILFFCFGFFTLALSTIRQYIAIGICITAYLNLKNKKIISILLIIIASTFHISAVIFIFIIVIDKIKNNWRAILSGILILFALSLVLKNTLIGLYLSISMKEYSSYEVGGNLMVIFIFLNIILGIIYKKHFFKNNNVMLFIIISLAGIIFSSTRFNLAVMRLYLYYFVFIIIYIPNIVFYIHDHITKYFLMFGFTAIAIYFSISNIFKTAYQYGSQILPYLTYWQ